jgi:hypothetical protein
LQHGSCNLGLHRIHVVHQGRRTDYGDQKDRRGKQ